MKWYLAKFLKETLEFLSVDPVARHTKRMDWIAEWMSKNQQPEQNPWKDPKREKPIQGKKVLCVHCGDIYVAQRVKDCWFSIPFYDSVYSRYYEPEFWQQIIYPNNLTGIMRINLNDKLYTLDELEKEDNDIFEQIYSAMLNSFDSVREKAQQDHLFFQESLKNG